MTTFRATHRITTASGASDVMLTDSGAAYTAAEWEANDTADFERSDSGEWTFHGQPFAGSVEAIDQTVSEIADILKAYGELFHGGRPEEVAVEWVEAGITDLDAVDGWCKANVWEPRVAAALRAAHVSPQRLSDIAAKIISCAIVVPWRKRLDQDCPIYALCNGDISVDDLIAAL